MKELSLPNVQRYTRAAIGLHWLIAVLMALNTALGLSADHWPDDWVRPVIDTHKSIGVTVLGLALMRILWRATHRPPPLPTGYARWERIASHLAHLGLYALILALPISGWMHDSAWKAGPTHPIYLFGLIPFPRIGWIANLPAEPKEHLHDVFFAWHVWFGYCLYALVALHILGALKTPVARQGARIAADVADVDAIADRETPDVRTVSPVEPA